MKAKIFTLLSLLLLTSIGCKSQNRQTYNSKYYTLDLPMDWTYSEDDFLGGRGSALSANRLRGDVVINAIFYLSMEQQVEPKLIIEQQIINHPLLKGADIDNMKESSFEGIPSKKVTNKTEIGGATYSSTCYCFIKDGVTHLIIEGTKSGDEIDYEKSIWSTIRFKDVDLSSTKSANVDDEIVEIIDNMKSMVGGEIKQKVDEGLYMIDLDFDSIQKCLIYDYEFTDMIIEDDSRAEFEALLKPEMIKELNRIRDNIELVRRCMDAGYSFRYRYRCNGKIVGDITVTKEEYNNI